MHVGFALRHPCSLPERYHLHRDFTEEIAYAVDGISVAKYKVYLYCECPSTMPRVSHHRKNTRATLFLPGTNLGINHVYYGNDLFAALASLPSVPWPSFWFLLLDSRLVTFFKAFMLQCLKIHVTGYAQKVRGNHCCIRTLMARLRCKGFANARAQPAQQ
jgi:hypothetical protein